MSRHVRTIGDKTSNLGSMPVSLSCIPHARLCLCNTADESSQTSRRNGIIASSTVYIRICCNDQRIFQHSTLMIRVCMSCVPAQVLDTSSGAELASLSQGHHESINCCVYNPLLQELYTGANDHQILVWQVDGGRENAGSQAGHSAKASDMQEDNWDD